MKPFHFRSRAQALFAFFTVVMFTLLVSVAVQAAGAPSTNNTRDLSTYTLASIAVTCPDDGAGTAAACNLVFPYKQAILYTCADANGCNITFLETGAPWDGYPVRIVNVSANAVNFADTPGVSELAGAFAAGQWDTLTVMYATDRFVELSRSNN